MLRVLAIALLSAPLLAAASFVMADQKTSPRVHREAFTVVGLEGRTTNANEMSSGGIIPKLWERLMKEGLLATIPDRAGDEIIALYTDYQSDKDGAYTYTLGARVSRAGTLPEGMKVRTVPAGDYASFSVHGKLANDAVVGLWRQVWQLESDHRIARAYQSDYEVHHLAEDGERAVELYIGVKN